MAQLPPNDHPWKFAWKQTERGEAEASLEGTSESGLLFSPSASAVTAWLSAHASDMIDCPLGPDGIRISSSACAARQRAFASACTCSRPPVLPRDRDGTLLGDADHFKLKGQRGSLAQKYGRKAADAFTVADAPETLKGRESGSSQLQTRARDTSYVQDREAESWVKDNEDRELVRDIIRGRVWA